MSRGGHVSTWDWAGLGLEWPGPRQGRAGLGWQAGRQDGGGEGDGARQAEDGEVTVDRLRVVLGVSDHLGHTDSVHLVVIGDVLPKDDVDVVGLVLLRLRIIIIYYVD